MDTEWNTINYKDYKIENFHFNIIINTNSLLKLNENNKDKEYNINNINNE